MCLTPVSGGAGANWEAVWGATTDQLIEYDRFELGAAGRFVPITDHRNSIVGWWDADREQLDDVLEYTPHGRIRLLQPDGTQRCVEEGTGVDCVRQWVIHPFGFASAYRSEFAGIINMRNRWYDPKLGQFLTHDPLGYIDAYNAYAYVGFDPINFFDPYGLGKQLALGLQQGMSEKVLEYAEFAANGFVWFAESLFDPIDRKIGDFNAVRAIAQQFIDHPEELEQLLPFYDLGEHGRLAREAHARDDYFNAGRHLFKALIGVALDIGIAGLVDKLADAARVAKVTSRICSFTEGTPVLMCDGT